MGPQNINLDAVVVYIPEFRLPNINAYSDMGRKRLSKGKTNTSRSLQSNINILQKKNQSYNTPLTLPLFHGMACHTKNLSRPLHVTSLTTPSLAVTSTDKPSMFPLVHITFPHRYYEIISSLNNRAMHLKKFFLASCEAIPIQA
jgi:hypothetical protein